MRNVLGGEEMTLGDLVVAVYDDLSGPEVPKEITSALVTLVIFDHLGNGDIANRLHLKTLQQRL
jgi:hypothetical protein